MRIDFEGDQWTFFKPPPEDLERLFGIDIHEMQPYRPLPEQIAEQLGDGRTLIVELDSWYLPDTAATSYRTEHVKTSVVAEAIDRDAERLRYFHNTGLTSSTARTTAASSASGASSRADVLPPYTELVRFDAGPRLRGRRAARGGSLSCCEAHLARPPGDQPVRRFGDQLGRDSPAPPRGRRADYHDYAFATVRMAGSGLRDRRLARRLAAR